MRGKVCSPIFTPLVCGITPAYAGKRLWGNNRRGRNEDHPRVYGEKFIRLALPDLHRGSPPRMRGKEPLRAVTICCVRITPAYAGKSLHPPAEYILTGDHPRVCGEKGDAASYRAWRRGSPPRMRGKAPCWALRHITDGITPAYAGKRLMVTSHSARTWDHPRVCGEKWCVVAVLQIKQGSPPRMRGKVRCRRCP